MDRKEFLSRRNSILETFQEVRDELSEAIYTDNSSERLNKFWDAEEKLLEKVYLKFQELSSELYHENKALRREVKFHE